MRRLCYVTAAGLVMVLLFGGIFWLRERQTAADRLADWQAEREVDATWAVLAREFEFERDSVTLSQFAELIAAKSGLAVEIDEKGIAGERKSWYQPREIRVEVPAGNFSLEAALRLVLVQAGLYPDLRGQVLVITTRDNSVELARLRTAVYPLSHAANGMDESAWAQIVAANIDGQVEAVPGAILVVANAVGHRRTRLVIDTVGKLGAATSEQVAIPSFPLTAREKLIVAALDESVALDVVEMSLKDVMLHFVERHNVPLVLMANKLEEASVSVDTPITKSLKDISLRSVLGLILKDLELTYVIRDEALVITTPEDAEEHLRTVTYPVHDLTRVDEKFFDVDSLVELIWVGIAPESWGDGNSGGPIGLDNGWMVVTQTDYVQDQVAGLIAAMRRILASNNQVEVQSIQPQTEAIRKIRAALERSIALDFEAVPLKDVVIQLGKSLQVPIILNLKRLDEASVSPDVLVTCHLPMARVGNQLVSLLDLLELDFVVRDEVLQIATPEDVESRLETRVYDTRDLIASRISADELRTRIESMAGPATWSTSGGPGYLKVYRGLLVVSHIERVHERIEKLLAALGEIPKREGPPKEASR